MDMLSLTVTPVLLADEGRYTLTATNVVGMDSAFIDVDVQCKEQRCWSGVFVSGGVLKWCGVFVSGGGLEWCVCVWGGVGVMWCGVFVSGGVLE